MPPPPRKKPCPGLLTLIVPKLFPSFPIKKRFEFRRAGTLVLMLKTHKSPAEVPAVAPSGEWAQHKSSHITRLICLRFLQKCVSIDTYRCNYIDTIIHMYIHIKHNKQPYNPS